MIAGDGQKRLLNVCDQKVILRNYEKKEIRLIFIDYLLAQMLPRYSHQTAEKLYDKFIANARHVKMDDTTINLFMKKKRHLSAMLSAMKPLMPSQLSWSVDKKINLSAATNS